MVNVRFTTCVLLLVLAYLEGIHMAAMKPRTGDGPLEAAKEGRSIIVRVPLDGGGRLVVELTTGEAAALEQALHGIAS